MHLIIIACVAAAPTNCHEVPGYLEHLDDGLTAETCPAQGDALAAAWARIHRRWKVTGWRCTDAAPEPPRGDLPPPDKLP